MKYICPLFLLICSILSLYFALRIIFSEDRKDTDKLLSALMCIGSFIWSTGFGALLIQTSPERAYYCRAFGMSGVFLYLITAQILICHLSGIPRGWSFLFDGLSLLGIPVYFLTIDRSQSVYFLTSMGMSYSFRPGFANNIYMAYSVMLALFMLTISIYMIHFSSVRRIRLIGKRCIIMIVLMMLGTVLDTLLPLIGLPAIPGSTLTQFGGMTVLYIAVQISGRSKINVKNTSEFIYYSISTPILVFDGGYRLQIANDAAAEFLNINPSILSQKEISIPQLFDVDQDSAFLFPDSYKNLDSLCQRNGLYCSLNINKIKDSYDDIIGYIIIITDLTERMKNLQRLEEAKKEAEAANRSKSTFLANMSHEIRTPMNAIMGFSELILKMDIDSKVQEYVMDIKKSCQNLLAVINDILDISKLSSGKMELSCTNYYTGTLLQDVYHIIDVQARKKGLRFVMEVDPRTPHRLYGDKTHIRGILINVLNNAVKYTEKGSVTFTVRVLEQQEDTVKLAYIVADTGIGIKESAMPQLFESFARLDPQKTSDIEGTGLGLSIVNGYTQLMGGSVTVDSTYGEGSTFTVTLPQKIIDSKPVEWPPASAETSSSLNTGEMKITDTRVLVTDDNQINLKVISNTLEYYGFQVDTAASGMNAVALCRQTEYDLIFMDQMMPGMDGIETMHRIRTISPHYKAGGAGKIIALTANAFAGMRNELMAKGFDEYLGKPLNFRELERVIIRFVPEDKIVTGSAPAAPEPASSLSQLLEDINTDAGIQHCGGDRALYMEILHLLHDSAPDQMTELKTLWEAEDFKSFTIQIHSVKGQLMNIGHASLSETARKLEYASREGNREYINTYLEPFIKKYQKLMLQLEAAFAAS